MSPEALFVTGLAAGAIAGGASCAAVQGGLLAGAVTRRTPPARARRGRHAAPRERSAAAPLAVFLTGKLISHTAAGAVLGASGQALQPGPGVRALLLIGAALLMLLFGLELLGLPLARRLAPRTPSSWYAFLRRGSRSGWALAPAALGVGTILVPCGVTMSMALVAVTSGSPVGGAAVMAGFVVGTAPLFTVLGYVLRTSARIWQGRMRTLTGIAVLAIAVWTAYSGMRLAGWTSVPTARLPAAAANGGPQTVVVYVLDDGYRPAAPVARAGVPARLVLRTHRTAGCTRIFVIPELGIERALPANGDTTLDLPARPAGPLSFTCGMGMYGGRVTFIAAK